jgi:hypothetical protein
VNALDHGIRFEKQQPFRIADFKRGAIIARAEHDGFIRRQVAREAADEFELVHSFPNPDCRAKITPRSYRAGVRVTTELLGGKPSAMP